MHTHAHTHTHIYIYSLTLQTLANVSSELFAKSKRLFNQISMLFSRNRGNQKKKKHKKKLSAHGKTKSKHNWIGLETGGEKKTTTRSNQKCKCATISKCAQNAFNGYKNRQGPGQRQGRGLRQSRAEVGGGKFGSFWIFLYSHKQSLWGVVCTCQTADAQAEPIFDLHGKLSASSTVPPLWCYACAAAALWRVAATTTEIERVTEKDR